MYKKITLIAICCALSANSAFSQPQKLSFKQEPRPVDAVVAFVWENIIPIATGAAVAAGAFYVLRAWQRGAPAQPLDAQARAVVAAANLARINNLRGNFRAAGHAPAPQMRPGAAPKSSVTTTAILRPETKIKTQIEILQPLVLIPENHVQIAPFIQQITRADLRELAENQAFWTLLGTDGGLNIFDALTPEQLEVVLEYVLQKGLLGRIDVADTQERLDALLRAIKALEITLDSNLQAFFAKIELIQKMRVALARQGFVFPSTGEIGLDDFGFAISIALARIEGLYKHDNPIRGQIKSIRKTLRLKN